MPLDSDVEKTGDGIIDAPSGRALRKPVVGDLVAQGKVKMHRVAVGILCTDGPSLVIVNDTVPARGSFGDLTHLDFSERFRSTTYSAYCPSVFSRTHRNPAVPIVRRPVRVRLHGVTLRATEMNPRAAHTVLCAVLASLRTLSSVFSASFSSGTTQRFRIVPFDSDAEKTDDSIIDAPSGRALRKPVVGDLVAEGNVGMHQVDDGVQRRQPVVGDHGRRGTGAGIHWRPDVSRPQWALPIHAQ